MDTVPKTREDLLVEIEHVRGLLQKAHADLQSLTLAAAVERRDQFAMHAPITDVTIDSAIERVRNDHPAGMDPDAIARGTAWHLAQWAYRYADAMQAAREKTKP